MPSPRVSVIICTYRREQSLCWIISDILAQKFSDYELIVVDQTLRHDPETEVFLRANADRLRLFHLETANLPNARNFGVGAARGELIVFIDDDLRIDADFIGQLVAHFEDKDVDAVAPIVVGDHGLEVAKSEYFKRYGRPLSTRTGLRLRAKEVIGACMAIRKSLIQAVGGFDPRLGELHKSAAGEDYDFFRRVSARKSNVFIDPCLTALHNGFTPGGCEVRTGKIEENLRVQLRAVVYITRKEDASANRTWLWTWARLLRKYLVRRDLYRIGLTGVRQRIIEVSEAVKYVRSFTENFRPTSSINAKAME